MTDKKVSELVEATDLTGATFLVSQGGASKKAPATLLLNSPTIVTPTLTTPTLTLKQGSAPTPTAEGDIQWDTDDDLIVVGDGSAQKRFYPQLTGVWTPTISFGGSSSGVTYGGQNGVYIKRGRLVYIEGNLGLSNNGSGSGTALIGGLPFAANQAWGQIGFSYWGGTSGIVGCLFGAISSTPNSFTLRHGGATGSATCTEANITNTADLYFSGCYYASS